MQNLNIEEMDMVGGGSRLFRFVRDAVVGGIIYDAVKTVASSIDVAEVGDPMDTKLGINS